MQSDLDLHIERVRQRMDAKKAAVDADVAVAYSGSTFISVPPRLVHLHLISA
jgi:hypothetical protein